jgi:hypothetical protein
MSDFFHTINDYAGLLDLILLGVLMGGLFRLLYVCSKRT